MAPKRKEKATAAPAIPKAASSEPNSKPAAAVEPPAALAVVGIGASAGGLAALKTLFAEVPKTSGLAYVVVMHLSPRQPSMLPELLQAVSAIPVMPAKDGQPLEPDHVYVAIPTQELSVYHGRLQLMDAASAAPALPIDAFLKSLALDKTEHAVAIILSGTGSDGTQGVREIKAHGGLVLVQSEASAAYDGMPRSAIATGLADLVLPPEQMPDKLQQVLIRHRRVSTELGKRSNEPGEWLAKVFSILRARLGHDFSAYKTNTLCRRISRRMSLNQIESYETYVRYLRENPDEIDALFRELLIGVTAFFRDTEVFEALKANGLPELIERLHQDETLRAWVPGCSSGEEVYSLAMVIREYLDTLGKRVAVQIFGTDIDKDAIDKARSGLYPASVAADVGKEHLKRFFSAEGDHYRIRKEIRDQVVFSTQDLLMDPPFSRLHLLCCRNVLIYFDTSAQKKLLPLFHYTLTPGGLLVLGSSETIGGFTHLFEPVDKKRKIFRRLETTQPLRQELHFPSRSPGGIAAEADTSKPVARLAADLGAQAREAILERFAPAAVLVSADGEILHVQGRMGKYLELPTGPVSHNIVDLAREGLRIELSSALRAARTAREPVLRRHIRIRTNGATQLIDLHVLPQRERRELRDHLLVAFEDVAPEVPPSGEDDIGEATSSRTRIAELEQELQLNRENHQSTVEELESSNEELKSTNEELQSANEELQSTNEELESSKEELQSLNEELQTVNAELESKVEELSTARDDIRNLLNSTDIATIFVDNALRVRRFTQEATTIVNLIQSDIGRPLEHVKSNLVYDAMITDLQQVLETLIPKQEEVETNRGNWYNMRVMPYRTTDNRIDGAVLTFSGIDDQKATEQRLNDLAEDNAATHQLMREVFDMNTEALVILDQTQAVVNANRAFLELAGSNEASIQGSNLLEWLSDAPDTGDLVACLTSPADSADDFVSRSVAFRFADTPRSLDVHGRIIRGPEASPYRVLLRLVDPATRGDGA
jgi:two-component system CheB/CheR fusion protein